MASRALEQLVDEITVDAYGPDEQLWVFRQVFEDEVAMPAAAAVLDVTVEVVAIDYDGENDVVSSPDAGAAATRTTSPSPTFAFPNIR